MTEAMTDTTIAWRITELLGRSTERLTQYIGASDFYVTPIGVTFTFKARSKNRANALRVVLNPIGTFTVQFLRAGRASRTLVSAFHNVPESWLPGLFEQQTGLHLPL